jgi:hypothetical protein
LKVAVNFRRSLLLIGQEIRLRPIPVQFFPTTSTYAGAASAAQYLVGANVQVFNASFSGDGRQLATFSDGMDKIGFEQGVALTTGDAQFAGTFGNSNPGDQMPVNSSATDADLNAINGSGYPEDAAILQFDVQTTDNVLNIEYVFASDEYLQYVGSNFNDAFGFFVSGPGISGPFSNNAVNIATINGSPVSVNTVNPLTNSQFYIDNQFYNQGFLTESNALFQYDGLTVVLTASIPVQCNTTYHIKIGICNTNDHIYDSAVFLKRGTITSAYASPGPLTIAPSPVCAGEEITLNVQGDPSWNYTWSTGQSGVGLQTVTTNASLDLNTYSVTAEYLPGCSLSTASPSAMLTVHDPQNSPPQCLGMNGTGVYSTTMQVGQQTCFTIPTNDAANERTEIQGTDMPGGSFTGNNAFHESGTFCWTPTADDIGFHTLETNLSDDNVCGPLSSTCTINIKVVCDFCPIRVFYERRSPDGLPLPDLTVAGESITAGHSVDPDQEDGDVSTGNASVEFRAPYIDLQPGFFSGPGFLAVTDPNTCIEDCSVCCDGWGGFTVDTYGEGTHNVLANVFTPNGDGVNDIWQVLDQDHPYCAYGAMAFDLHIFNQWGSTVWRLQEGWAAGCCPFRSRAPGYNVISSIYWDGTANAGTLYCHGCYVSNSAYYYVLTLTGCNGQVAYTGDITIFGSPAGIITAPPPMQVAPADLVPDSVVANMTDEIHTGTVLTGAENSVVEPTLHLMPNPANGQVWLGYAPGLAHVWLLDAVGRRVLELSPQGAPTVTIQVQGLAPASYVLMVVDAEGHVHNRILIKQ